jgi:hypothetical protein
LEKVRKEDGRDTLPIPGIGKDKEKKEDEKRKGGSEK